MNLHFSNLIKLVSRGKNQDENKKLLTILLAYKYVSVWFFKLWAKLNELFMVFFELIDPISLLYLFQISVQSLIICVTIFFFKQASTWTIKVLDNIGLLILFLEITNQPKLILMFIQAHSGLFQLHHYLYVHSGPLPLPLHLYV